MGARVRHRLAIFLGAVVALILAALAWGLLAGPGEEPATAAGADSGRSPHDGPASGADPGQSPAALAASRLLPDLQVLMPSGLYIADERATGGGRRLKFTTTIWNAGPGPLEVRGHEDPATGALRAVQVFHALEGEVLGGELVGLFEFEHRHGHLHLAGFARYELWSLTPDDDLLEPVALNDKIGFCLMDNIVVDESLVDEAWGPYPADCLGDVQGISPGFGDIYVAQLFEQDLVLGDLPDGRYALINIANPDGAIEELRVDNNSALTYVRIGGNSVWQE